MRDPDLGHIRTDAEYKERKVTPSEINKAIGYDCRIDGTRNRYGKISEIGYNDGTHQQNGVYVGTHTGFDKKNNIDDRKSKCDQIYKSYYVQSIPPS